MRLAEQNETLRHELTAGGKRSKEDERKIASLTIQSESLKQEVAASSKRVEGPLPIEVVLKDNMSRSGDVMMYMKTTTLRPVQQLNVRLQVMDIPNKI